MRPLHRPRVVASLLAGALAMAACGDSAGSGTTGTPAATAATAGTTTTATTAAALPDGCTPPPFTVSIRTGGDGEQIPLTVTDAAASRKLEGRAFTVYLTDYAIDRDASLFGQVSEPPPGSTTVQTGIDVFNAPDAQALPMLAPGAVGDVQWTAGEPATLLNIYTDVEQAGFNANQAGTTELLYVDDDVVCMRSEITADSGTELSGTYLAEIVEDF